MISLESEVSGASLSDSAASKNKHHDYNCIKMTRAESFENTEWHVLIILHFWPVCWFFLNTLMRFSTSHRCFESIVCEWIVTTLTPLLFPLLFFLWHLIHRREILGSRNETWACSTERPLNPSLWKLLLPVWWHRWQSSSWKSPLKTLNAKRLR